MGNAFRKKPEQSNEIQTETGKEGGEGVKKRKKSFFRRKTRQVDKDLIISDPKPVKNVSSIRRKSLGDQPIKIEIDEANVEHPENSGVDFVENSDGGEEDYENNLTITSLTNKGPVVSKLELDSVKLKNTNSRFLRAYNAESGRDNNYNRGLYEHEKEIAESKPPVPKPRRSLVKRKQSKKSTQQGTNINQQATNQENVNEQQKLPRRRTTVN